MWNCKINNKIYCWSANLSYHGGVSDDSSAAKWVKTPQNYYDKQSGLKTWESTRAAATDW